MSLQFVHNKSRKGFSLTEFAIVLGVIGVVLSGLWSTIAIVRENMKRAEMKEQMVVVVAGVRDFYLSRACASLNQNCPAAVTDLTNYLLRNNALPYEQLRDRTVATWVADHPWFPGTAGGSLKVYSGDNSGSSPDRFFRVSLRDVGEGSCIALAPKLSGTGTPAGLSEVRIAGTLMNTAAKPLPVSPEDADTPCVDDVTMDFIYTLRAP